jgi:hypothetical protein
LSFTDDVFPHRVAEYTDDDQKKCCNYTPLVTVGEFPIFHKWCCTILRAESSFTPRKILVLHVGERIHFHDDHEFSSFMKRLSEHFLGVRDLHRQRV